MVFVVILNWNTSQDTLECLRALDVSTVPFHCCVVDNGSHPADLHALADWLAIPHLNTYSLVANPRNVGFSAANNIGIDEAIRRDADYVFILNNDTVVERDTIRRLVQSLEENPAAGGVAPSFTDANGTPSFSGERMLYWLGMRLVKRGGRTSGRTNFLPGAGMLLRTGALRGAGGFREDYFAYCEDIELCFRLGRHNWELLYSPSTTILHKQGRSSGGRWGRVYAYYVVRNGLHFARTQQSGIRKGFAVSLFVLFRLGYALAGLTRLRAGALAGTLHGLVDGFRGRLGERAL